MCADHDILFWAKKPLIQALSTDNRPGNSRLLVVTGTYVYQMLAVILHRYAFKSYYFCTAHPAFQLFTLSRIY